MSCKLLTGFAVTAALLVGAQGAAFAAAAEPTAARDRRKKKAATRAAFLYRSKLRIRSKIARTAKDAYFAAAADAFLAWCFR